MKKNRLQAQRRKPSQPTPKKQLEKNRGATESVTGLQDKFASLIRHHRSLLTATPRRLWQQKTQTLMTSMVIAIALGLPAFFYVAVVNLQAVGSGIESTGHLTVFLHNKTSAKQAQSVKELFAKTQGIAEVEYIAADAALAEFKAKSGFGEVLELLEENPLPAVLLVLPESRYRSDTQYLEKLIVELQQYPEVDDVLLDMRWLERLNTLLNIARNITLALGGLLSLGVLLIVGNTIRLEIENRKQEIRVVKLIGGTNAYVRRPFLYTGFWYGAFGGLLAWLLIAILVLTISNPAGELAKLYESNFHLQGVGLLNLLALVFIGTCLGLVGAYIAVGGHLASVEVDQ